MPGTRAGGLKAYQKNIEKDPDFYKKLGAKGGAAGNTGGFAYYKKIGNVEKIREAGAKGGRIGGRISRRKSNEN